MFRNACLTDKTIKEGKEMISLKIKLGVSSGMGWASAAWNVLCLDVAMVTCNFT